MLQHLVAMRPFLFCLLLAAWFLWGRAFPAGLLEETR